jgi:hypothetical protein
MHSSTYTVNLVSQQEKDFKDPNPPRGGFGLAEDDIIYRTVHETLEKDEHRRRRDRDESSDND